MKNQKTILDLTRDELKEFFLQEKNYCTTPLPSYIKFKPLLSALYDIVEEIKKKEKKEKKEKTGKKKKIENIKQKKQYNHTIFMNKDGAYSWRPIELINPVIYCLLIHAIKESFDEITSRFKEFQSNSEYIECMSIPVVNMDSMKHEQKYQILEWWKQVEQKSIELSLSYDYIHHTDIVNCYGSIYTHSIAWALHGEEKAKSEKYNEDLLGNKLDKLIRNMSKGQTNGIPQGSVMMDFIAEMVLGYADKLLGCELKDIKDYKIIRYRDDYRIFTNNPSDAKKILKELSVILEGLGMKLSSEKTTSSQNVIESSIKRDKLETLLIDFSKLNLQKQLLVIKSHVADKHPNSGTLIKMFSIYLKNIDKVISIEKIINQYPYLTKNGNKLNKTINRLRKFEYLHINISVLTSILTDIAFKNPKIYSHYILILNRLLVITDDKKLKKRLLENIKKKFDKIPNTEYLDLWLQRILLKIEDIKGIDKKSNGELFKLIEDIKGIDMKSNGELFKLIEGIKGIDMKSNGELFKLIEAVNQKHQMNKKAVNHKKKTSDNDNNRIWIWNFDFVKKYDTINEVIKNNCIIDPKEIEDMDEIIPKKEVNIFGYESK